MDRLPLVFPIALTVEPGRGATTALVSQLREAILEGRLAIGTRLPPTRQLAKALGVARTTVVVTYDMLVAEGYASVRQGDGTFVSPLRRSAANPPVFAPSQPMPKSQTAAPAPRFDLRLGAPDIGRFPFDVWRRMVSKACRPAGSGSSPSADPAGAPVLREAIAGHASASRAVSCSSENIIVTAGAQQAFDLLARLLVRPGAVVAVEDPGYPPMRAAFALAGAQIIAVPVDAHGMVIEKIPQGASIICVTPSHQFPLGTAMSPERRAALLNYAQQNDSFIVEDDYDCEFRYDDRPLDALQTLDPGRVCYVGTFSKTMFPSLRLGFAIVPSQLRGPLLDLRRVADGFGPPGPQIALACFIGEGHLNRHVRRMLRVYAQRRQALLLGLEDRMASRIEILPAKAGLHFSMKLRFPVDWVRALERAASLGVAFEPCSRYALKVDMNAHCAIGFGLLAEDQIVSAVDRLHAVFA